MIAYRELVTPETAFSAAVYRVVECKEEEILARLAARPREPDDSPEAEPSNAATR